MTAQSHTAPTADEIEAAKTPAGAWTKATLAGWGVSWPPQKGWKAALLAGQSPPTNTVTVSRDAIYDTIMQARSMDDAADRVFALLRATGEAGT